MEIFDALHGMRKALSRIIERFFYGNNMHQDNENEGKFNVWRNFDNILFLDRYILMPLYLWELPLYFYGNGN